MSILPASPQPVAAYAQVLSDIQASNYMAVASYTLLLYDVLITLDSEYEFVWKSRISPGMAMYIIMRYGTILLLGIGLPYNMWPDAPFQFCKIWLYIDPMLGATLMVIPVFGILALRTYALYHQKRIFKWILVFLFISVNVVLVACFIVHLTTVRIRPPFAPGLTCFLGITYASKRIIIIQYLAPLIYDSIIFILTMFRIYQSWRDARIVKIIFRNCLLYYTIMVFTEIPALVFITRLPDRRAALRELFMDPLRSISVVLASRLVLRLRQYVAEPDMSLSTLSSPIQ